MPDDLYVIRYGIWNEMTKSVSGDYIRVGDTDLGEFADLRDAEYRRAESAFNMRPMWWTGSPYGREILKLAEEVRSNTGEPQ